MPAPTVTTAVGHVPIELERIPTCDERLLVRQRADLRKQRPHRFAVNEREAFLADGGYQIRRVQVGDAGHVPILLSRHCHSALC